ncbi:urease accessory protein UreE [Ramlibacter sp.]|uniref:urease accessory protein UreE n=1 Tax=Ramlibacter sp. TaxID=1917967 RepID=UPI002FC99CC5
MLTCNEIRPAGTWDESTAADTVVLDFDARHRRRHAMNGQAGLAWLLDLPQPAVLRSGDGLVLSDGRIVRVDAAPERLMEISAPDAGALVRIAWHLGNRHLPTQLVRDRLRIRHDHVMEAMVNALGGTVVAIEAPFDPEGGAFAQAGPHGRAHGHAPAPSGAHGHDHHEHAG